MAVRVPPKATLAGGPRLPVALFASREPTANLQIELQGWSNLHSGDLCNQDAVLLGVLGIRRTCAVLGSQMRSHI